MAEMYLQFIIMATILFCKISVSHQVGNYTTSGADQYIAQHKNTVNQQYRLKYHAMPPIGWTNDPNGFIYYKNEYHLFYQFNPYDSLPNKIHWGHSKSKDLTNWEDLPVALAPDELYDEDGVFSGSAIEIDGKLHVMYTGYSKTNGQVQCVAVSEDGITFKKVPENPVITAATLPPNAKREDFRDPKVFKRDSTYYVVLASKTVSNTGQILLYQSPDFIHWTFKSILLEGTRDTGIMWECPDLFQLDGKDVLLLSPIEMPRQGYNYHNYDSVIEFVGLVNWDTGKLNHEVMKEIDHGMDFYATQSLRDGNGRRIVIAWMSMWNRKYPTHTLKHGWTGSMTIPRELRLINNYVVQKPAFNIDIFKKVKEYENVDITNLVKELNGVEGAVGVLDLVIKMEINALVTIEVRKHLAERTTIIYDNNVNLLTLDRRVSGHVITGVENPPVFSRSVELALKNNILTLQILLDQSSVEIFANNGTETLSANIYPTNEKSIEISFSSHGGAVIESLRFSYSNGLSVLPVQIVVLMLVFMSFLL